MVVERILWFDMKYYRLELSSILISDFSLKPVYTRVNQPLHGNKDSDIYTGIHIDYGQ